MKPKTNDIYLYLAKRDKTGIRILAKVRGQQQLPSRIGDIKTLNMPQDWTTNISQIILTSKMMWEPWIQSADSYEDLRNALKSRGFSNIPVSPILEFSPANVQTPLINSSNLPNRKTMVRKPR